MTKRQVVWLIIKLIGVYFAYSAIVAVPGVISSIYAYGSLPSPPRFGKADTANTNSNINIQPVFPNPNANTATKPEIETPAEKAKNEALKLFIWNLLATVFYGLVGWYLIRDGRFLFALLSRESSGDISDEPTETTSYSSSRKKEEVVTSLNLSGRKEEITSLNLSDSKNKQAVPQTPIDAPVNAPDAAPPEKTVSSLNLSDSPAEQTQQASVLPVETAENTLLEIPEDESIDEQKY